MRPTAPPAPTPADPALRANFSPLWLDTAHNGENFAQVGSVEAAELGGEAGRILQERAEHHLVRLRTRYEQARRDAREQRPRRRLQGAGRDAQHRPEKEVEFLRQLNRTVLDEGVSKGQPRILTDIDACETILSLAPETNGEVAVKAWQALSKLTGRELRD